MSDPHQVRRLRIRPGPGSEAAARARVLADVAHRLLPGELDEALRGLVGDDAEVEVPGVTVRLEVDPRDTDDATLAALWAGLIRAEVLRSLDGTTDRASSPVPEAAREPVDNTAAVDHPGAPAARAADLAAVLAGLLAGHSPGPADLRALTARATDDAVTVEALARLPRPQRTPALDLLRAAGVAPAASLLRVLDLSHPAASTSSTSPGSSAQATSAGARPGSGSPDPADAGDGGATVGRPTPAPAATPSPVTDPGLSSYGGLVLVHHRLRPLLEDAGDAAPHADPVAVRLDVLAELCRPAPSPDDPRPVREDPLLRLLAGDPGWLDRPAPPVSGVPVDQDAADDALRGFASDLPGFASSTPGFVRAHWVERRALLVPDRDAVLLRLERRPLDLLLDRLPYPIGALRLPWTPTLLVGWEGA